MTIKKMLVLSLLLTLSSVQASETKSPSLKEVMQGIAESMSELGLGIFTDDFDIIQDAAKSVAIHPKPKEDLGKIIKLLGKRMPLFKKRDMVVHSSAMRIVQFAKEENMKGVVDNHAILVKGCVACHGQFRDQISKELAK